MECTFLSREIKECLFHHFLYSHSTTTSRFITKWLTFYPYFSFHSIVPSLDSPLLRSKCNLIVYFHLIYSTWVLTIINAFIYFFQCVKKAHELERMIEGTMDKAIQKVPLVRIKLKTSWFQIENNTQLNIKPSLLLSMCIFNYCTTKLRKDHD